jgi:hypothetical protein
MRRPVGIWREHVDGRAAVRSMRTRRHIFSTASAGELPQSSRPPDEEPQGRAW